MNLSSLEYGSGPPLVILHGLLGSSDNWSTLAKRFAERFHVLIPDARNHGRSPHSTELSYAVMADDVREFLTQRGLQSAAIIGHSMGGKTAMTLALAHPEMVDRLVVVDIGPGKSSESQEKILTAMENLDLREVQTRAGAERLIEKDIPSKATRQFVLKNLGRSDDGTYRWKINLTAIHRHLPEIESEIVARGMYEGPSLFVSGGRSSYVVAEHHNLIKKYFPSASFTTIPNAGHWVHADAPEEFYNVVSEFLGRT